MRPARAAGVKLPTWRSSNSRSVAVRACGRNGVTAANATCVSAAMSRPTPSPSATSRKDGRNSARVSASMKSARAASAGPAIAKEVQEARRGKTANPASHAAAAIASIARRQVTLREEAPRTAPSSTRPPRSREVHQLFLDPGEALPDPGPGPLVGKGAAGSLVERHELGVADELPETLVLRKEVLAQSRHQLPRQRVVGSGDQLQPEGRQPRGEQGNVDGEDAPPTQGADALEDLTTAQDLGPGEVEPGAALERKLGGADQSGDHVGERHRARARPEPLRKHHHRESHREVAHDLPRGTPVP